MDGAPNFAQSVPAGGYAWWYLDALSEDGRHGLTIIAFVGSVFSPYYHWSGRAEPENHVAINVALYGERGHRWSITERGCGALDRSVDRFRVGPSHMLWERDGLTLHLDELAVPHLSRIKGTIRVDTNALNPRSFQLDAKGRHHWRPIAPLSHVSVDLDSPDLSWRGNGYIDSNWGAEPLEDGFERWDWARTTQIESGKTGQRATILYYMQRRDGSKQALALRFGRDGNLEELTPPPRVVLPGTFWRVDRRTQADTTDGVTVRQTLEDAPFYARSVLDSRLYGERVEAVHETLDLDRFRLPVVKLMLPFRMPRRA